MNDPLKHLRDYLGSLPSGPVEDRAQLLEVLKPAWSQLDGSHDWAMESHKLSRMEDPHWDSPILTFGIERHGAVVAGGSTRAEMQTWVVEIVDASAQVGKSDRRQLRPMAPRLDVQRLAEEAVSLVRSGADDDRLKWSADRARVTVKIGIVIPADGFKQTVEGRRKRFREVLREAMTSAGWREVPGTSPNTYERSAPESAS